MPKTTRTLLSWGIGAFCAGALWGQAPAASKSSLEAEIIATALRAEVSLDGAEKDLERRVEQRRKRQRRAEKSLGRKASREDRLQVLEVNRGEQSLFHGIRGRIQDQRRQVLGMKNVEAHGVESLSRHAVEVSRLATSMEKRRKSVADREKDFNERWESIEESGMNPHFREQKAAEEEALEIIRKLDLQKASLTRYTLAVSGSMSLAEGAARNARIRERERARYRQRRERLEESKKAWLGLLTALGTAAVVSGVDPPSAEERKKSLEDHNRSLATRCAAQGGYFYQPAEGSLGTCLTQ